MKNHKSQLMVAIRKGDTSSKLFSSVKHKLQVDHQVTFEESSLALLEALSQIKTSEPTQRFVNECLGGIVDIFLAQHPHVVNRTLLIHFEDVFRSASRLISWQLKRGEFHSAGVLGNVLDVDMPFYSQENKILIEGLRKPCQIRVVIAKELLDEGVFALLSSAVKDGRVSNAKELRNVFWPVFKANFVEVDRAGMAREVVGVVKGWTAEELRKQKAEDVDELMGAIGKVVGNEEAFVEAALGLWVKCFESEAFPLKKMALDAVIKMCDDAAPAKVGGGGGAGSAFTAATTSTSSPDFATNAPWNVKRICSWLVHKRVVEILFGEGAQTHTVLVAKSMRLLEHMAQAGTLGETQIDMIFESSVGKHDSSRGAVQSLLAELAMELSASHETNPPPAKIILQRATTLCVKRPQDMFFFVRKLMQLESTSRNRGIMISRNLELQKALLELLWTLLVSSWSAATTPTTRRASDILNVPIIRVGSFASTASLLLDEVSPLDAAADLENRREEILHYFNDAMRSAIVPIAGSSPTSGVGFLANRVLKTSQEKTNEDKILNEYTNRCLDILKSNANDDAVWAAFSVLKSVIQLHPEYSSFEPVFGALNLAGGAGSNMSSWNQPTSSQSTMYKSPEWIKRNQTDFLNDLENTHALVESVVGRIKAVVARVDITSDDSRQLKTCLDFVRFVATRLPGSLSFERISTCWNALQQKHDRETKLQWFRELVEPDAALMAGTTGVTAAAGTPMILLGNTPSPHHHHQHHHHRHNAAPAPSVLTKDVAVRVFKDLICGISWEDLGATKLGFDCFASYFSQVNNHSGAFDGTNLPVLGLETLWDIAIRSPLRDVAEKAGKMLLIWQQRLENSSRAGNGEEFLNRVFSYLNNVAKGEDEITRRCICLLAQYLDLRIVVDSHYPDFALSKNVLDIVIHHDEVWTYSQEDVGKGIEKRFINLQQTGGGFSWYEGVVFAYDSSKGEHHVFYRDGETKTYDMTKLQREDWHITNSPSSSVVGSGSGASSDRLYRALSAYRAKEFKQPLFKPDAGVVVPPLVAQAMGAYHGCPVRLTEAATMKQVKTMLVDRLGRGGFVRSGWDESKLEIHVDLSSAPLPALDFLVTASSASYGIMGGGGRFYQYKIVNEDVVSLGHVLAKIKDAQCEIVGMFLCYDVGARQHRSTTTTMTAAAEVGATLPSSVLEFKILSKVISEENSVHHAELMNLLDEESLSQDTKLQVWNLLMNLPTEQGLLRRCKSADFDWQRELLEQQVDATAVTTVLKQIYLLQIAHRILTAFDERDAVGGGASVGPHSELFASVRDDEAFKRNFFKPKMANAVFQLFNRVSSLPGDIWEQAVSLRVLVGLIRRFVFQASVGAADELLREIDTQLLSRNLSSLMLVDVEIQDGDAVEAREGAAETEDGIPSKSSTLVTVAAVAAVAAPAAVASTTNPAQQGVALDAITIHSYLAQNKMNHAHLLAVIERKRGVGGKSIVDVLLESKSPLVRSGVRQILIQLISADSRDLVVDRVLATLSRMPDNVPTCGDFFQFIEECVDDAIATRKLMEIVEARLAKYDPENSVGDSTLCGFLELYRVIVDRVQGQQQLLKPEDERSEFSQDAVSILLNKLALSASCSLATRRRTYDLVRALVGKNSTQLKLLTRELESFVSSCQIPVNKFGKGWDFRFRPEDVRRQGSYVGLVNQGATCYQNSILQQLFMQRQFRDLILKAAGPPLAVVGDAAADDDDPVAVSMEPAKKKKNAAANMGRYQLFSQLQRVFSTLMSSEQKFTNPRQFVMSSSALRLTDGHMNQNDAVEFFSLLFDYLEENLKSRLDREKLKQLFTCGTTSLNIRHCPPKHQTEREDLTCYTSVNIRSGAEGSKLNSLDEALDAMLSAERLTDLQCEDCFPPRPKIESANVGGGGGATGGAPQKFDADQIKFFSRFPEILLFQLLRFDFDYERGQPIKINHRVSFERRMDLGRFSRQAVMKRFSTAGEAVAVDASAGGLGNNAGEILHVWYRLKGVVVHQGMGANFGHYYSFIEDADGKWFRFDDDRVTPFDDSNLDEECFGGPVSASVNNSYNSATAPPGKRAGSLRNNNAYLLIYAKEKEDAKEKVTEAPVVVVAPVVVPAAVADPSLAKPLSLGFVAKLAYQLQSLKRRAQFVVEAKLRAQILEAQVLEENQKAHRHVIAFAQDFLMFNHQVFNDFISSAIGSGDVNEETGLELAQYATDVLMKIVLFADTEKDRLQDWFDVIRRVLRACDGDDDGGGAGHETATKWANWLFSKRVFDGEKWPEKMFMHCSDPRSSLFFAKLVMLGLEKCDADLAMKLAEILIALPLKNASHVDSTIFNVMKRLAERPDTRKFLLEHDAVFALISLLDEDVGGVSSQAQLQQSQQPQQPQQPQQQPQVPSVIREKDVVNKIIDALNALFEIRVGNEEEVSFHPYSHSWDDETAAALEGFPPMPITSQNALFAESFFNVLAHHAALSGRHLISRLLACDTATLRLEKYVSRWCSILNQLQSMPPRQYANADISIQECTDVLKSLLGDLPYGGPNAMALRVVLQDCLLQLCKMAKEARRVAQERKGVEAQGNYYTQYNNLQDADRRQQHKFACTLLIHVADLFCFLGERSDTCRAVLREELKWSAWMIPGVEENSYESFVQGHDKVFTRTRRVGMIARKIVSLAISLGLPRPLLSPALTCRFMMGECGSPECMGVYRFDGYFDSANSSENVDDDTPKFCRVDPGTGKRLTIFRCRVADHKLTWYISELSDKPGTTADRDYYQCHDVDGMPDGRWSACGVGVKPAPRGAAPEISTPKANDNLLEFL